MTDIPLNGAQAQNGRFLSHETLAGDLEALFEAIPHAMLIGDRHGLIRANGQALRLLDLEAPADGVPVSDLFNRSRLRHAHADRLVGDEDHPFDQALAGRASTCDVSTIDPTTFRPLSLRCHGVPLLRDGVQVGAMAVYADISDLRRTTDALNRTNQDLREFSAILAHDLNEPLRMIASYVDLASRCEAVHGDEQAANFLASSKQGVQRMKTLIEDLLKFTYAGRPLQRSRIDVTMLVQEVLENLAMTMQERGAEVVYDDLAEVYADPALLMLVFQNLLSNAAKYCDDVRPPLIAVTAERRPADTLFSVHDNGIGIAPEAYQRIFNPFDRLHAKDGTPGTGLGLSICRRVISRHRGYIWAESGCEHGTIFRFTIPHYDEDCALEPNQETAAFLRGRRRRQEDGGERMAGDLP